MTLLKHLTVPLLKILTVNEEQIVGVSFLRRYYLW